MASIDSSEQIAKAYSYSYKNNLLENITYIYFIKYRI